jgi:hypothetical protein
VPGYSPPAGEPYTGTIKINIGVTGTGNGVGQNTGLQGNQQQPGQKSGCPCAGEKCLCPSDKCGGKTFPQHYGTIIGKNENPGYMFKGDGPCYCDCEADPEYWRFLIDTCGYAISGYMPPETKCSGIGANSGNTGADQSQPPSGSDPFATGGILIDSADQGFNPNSHIGGYDDTSAKPGRILVDSTENGFNPTAPPLGEAI